ncbi:MAG: META domain-containing protein [Parapedobacter sp.]|nr:MAG: META domain-containing protein [Parapedobacter sp.]
MLNKVMKRSLLIVALAVVAAACDNTNTKNTSQQATVEEQVAADATDLFGKEWKLIELSGKAIQLDTTFNKEPHLIFNEETNRLNGNGGCNNFMGSFELKEGGGIELSQAGATMMACPNLELEGQFFDALEQTKSYRIEGNNLFLDNGKNEDLAKLTTE